MKQSFRRWGLVLGMLGAALSFAACGDDSKDKDDEKGKDDAGTGATGSSTNDATDDGSNLGEDKPTGEFHWFMDCGDPLCSEGAGHHAHPGVDLCDADEGDACSLEGDVCDPVDPCNANMKCAKSDPKPKDGCPMYGAGT